jgi:hypothetical protein
MQYIRSHPKRELLFVLRRINVMYARDDSVIRFTLRSRHYREVHSPPAGDRLASALVRVNTIFYYAVMACALIGLAVRARQWRNRDADMRWIILFGMILYNTLIFCIFTSVERYRFPVMPYFCVFAGLGVAAVVSAAKSRSAANAAAQRSAV